MPVKKADGSALANKAAVVALATETTREKVYKFNAPVMETYSLPGAKNQNTQTRVKFQAGQEVPESYIDRLFS